MSILISGMNKPKSCLECPFFNGATNYCSVVQYSLRNDQVILTSPCPLVEVPTPHGDLVDRDVVAENIRQRLGIRNLDYLLETEKPIAMSIKEAPTVIESEE